MFSLPLLLSGCAVFITDEEYAQRLTHTLSGELVVPAGVYVPGTAEVVLFPLVPDASAPIPEVPEPWIRASIEGLSADSRVSYTMSIPASPDEAFLGDGAVLGAEGTRVALFGLGVWTDEDGDGVMGPADTYIGLQTRDVLVWFEVGSDSAGAAAVEDLGAAAGYNIARYDIDRMRFGDYDAVPSTKVSIDVDANLALRTHDALDLSIGGAVARDGIRADLLNIRALDLDAPTFTSVAVPQSLSAQVVRFTADFLYPPPEHVSTVLDPDGANIDLSPYGLEAAVYGAVIYNDTNGDGRIDATANSASEMPLGYSVDSNGDGNLAFYLRPTHFRAALSAASVGDLGWTLVQTSANGENANRDWDLGMTVDRLLGG